MKEAKYWSCNQDEELLTATTIDEAVQEFIDGCEEIPIKVKVFGSAPMEVKWDYYGERALRDMLESIDEDYGDPDNSTDITDEMEKAAKEFAEKISKLYHVWGCEQVDVVEVDMLEWCKENEPDLIGQIKIAAQDNKESPATVEQQMQARNAE
jgi:hypothetical protein